MRTPATTGDREARRAAYDRWIAPPSRSLRQHLALLGLVAVAYYLGARLGLGLSLIHENVSPLWPPTGVALAAFVLRGRSMWPAVALAAFAVNLPISTSPLAAAATAVGNTAAPLLAMLLLRRVGFRRELDRGRDALAIVFLGALVSMLVSATVGAATLVVSRGIPAEQFPTAWAVWWTGDAMGVLVIAPFLLSLPLHRKQPWPPRRWAEAVAILVVTSAAALWAAHSHLHILFLALPFVGWAAWRLQLRGAAPAALIASVAMTWSAASGLAPFEGRSLPEQMFTLNAFNASVALTSFFLAALVTERMQAATALTRAATDLEERVEQRTAELSAANARLLQEIHDRSEAQELLSQEEARAQREHQIAETLQRSLLPDHLPEVPGLGLAARYLPATADMQVGGDWYDVVQLPGGLVGLAIGDVAGHGLQAAATMGQLRMAVRAYALDDPSPISVMGGVHRLVAQQPVPEMVTLMYLVLDPATRELRFCNAGHPPALVLGARGSSYLWEGLAAPIGVTADVEFTEVRHQLGPEDTLVLYTDGLVERRRASLREGLDRLGRVGSEAASATGATGAQGATDAQGAASVAPVDLEGLCDRLLTAMLDGGDLADDVALLVVRPLSLAGSPLVVRLPAEARMLVQARGTLRRWLREWEVPQREIDEILVACGEACANVVQHAYVADPGEMELEARLRDGSVEIVVRDQGRWRAPGDRGGGWGLQLVRAFMDAVDVDQGSDGTVVRMRRRLDGGGGR